jgi:hypothetical protein
MPLKLDPKIERSLWRLADALAKALRTPDAGNPGDPQWRVEALASRAWKVTHPDLPIVKDSEGAGKDVLLQFHVQQDPTSQKWFVVAQNKVVGPDTHASPQALIVAKEDEPPNERWDFESIGQAAANFFKKQKNDLVERAQAMMPPAQPGANEAPKQDDQGGGGGPPGGPMASYYRRRARLARRLNDPFDSGVQSSLAAGPQNTSRSATLITLEHLADTLDQKVKDLDTGSLSVSMVPTSGGQLLVQIFGTYQDYLREGKSLPSLLDKLVVKTSEELGIVLSPDADWKTYPNFRTKKTQPSGYTILGFRPWRMSHTREASSGSNGIPRTHPLSKMGRYIRGKFGRFEQIAPHVSLDAWYDPGYNPTTDKQDPKEATLNVTFTVNHKVFSQQKDKLEEFKRHANRIIDEAAQRYGVTVKGSRWTPDWNMRSKEEFLYYTYKKVVKLEFPNRKASVNLPRVLASDELYEEINRAARPLKRVVYTQTIPEVYSGEDHDYEDKDIHTLLVSFQPKNAEEDQKLVALLNPILRDFADKIGGYLLKRWYPDRYSNLYRTNIHFSNYHPMGRARDQALDIIKEATPHLKGHLTFTAGRSVSWGPSHSISLRLENHHPRDVIPDRKIIEEALLRHSIIPSNWRSAFNPRSQAERLPHDPITSYYDLQFAKPPTQRQSRFQKLEDCLLPPNRQAATPYGSASRKLSGLCRRLQKANPDIQINYGSAKEAVRFEDDDPKAPARDHIWVGIKANLGQSPAAKQIRQQIDEFAQTHLNEGWVSDPWKTKNPRSQNNYYYRYWFSGSPPADTRLSSRRQRLADRLLLLTDENRRKLEALTRKLKDQDLKADADFVQNQLLDWKNTLAEAPGTIRRNRTGSTDVSASKTQVSQQIVRPLIEKWEQEGLREYDGDKPFFHIDYHQSEPDSTQVAIGLTFQIAYKSPEYVNKMRDTYAPIMTEDFKALYPHPLTDDTGWKIASPDFNPRSQLRTFRPSLGQSNPKAYWVRRFVVDTRYFKQESRSD